MNRNWTQGILSFTVVGIVIGMLALGGSGALVAQAADPIKIGFGMALTGGLSANGKPALLALQIWKDDVNKKGGLLGRPVELVYYDDQTNPATSTSTRSTSSSPGMAPTSSPRSCPLRWSGS